MLLEGHALWLVGLCVMRMAFDFFFKFECDDSFAQNLSVSEFVKVWFIGSSIFACIQTERQGEPNSHACATFYSECTSEPTDQIQLDSPEAH